MSTLLTRLATLEEFTALPHAETERAEVMDGEMVDKMPPGYQHGQIGVRLIRAFDRWALQHGTHEVVAEVGFVLHNNPLVLLAPDLAIMTSEEVKRRHNLTGYWIGAPLVAVEIISPTERAMDVSAKVDRYLAAGAQLVLTVWPALKKIEAHAADGDSHTFRAADTLVFPDLLPDFSCSVESLFP